VNSVPQAPGSFPAASPGHARDLRLAWRHPDEAVLTVAFFVLVASLFPLGIGAEPQLLQRIGPGVIWVGALLAAFLALPGLFAADYADGSLEQMTLSPHPALGWAGGKIAAHWNVSSFRTRSCRRLIGCNGLTPTRFSPGPVARHRTPLLS